MKIQIKNLEPNPFRDIKNYPIDKTKIECLINSINQTGFWDNILARKIDGKIQIAYGHHRLIALKKIFKPDDYVDIPIRDLDDSKMIQVMANENHESWGMLPKVIDETVRVAKKFLEEHPEIKMTLRSMAQRVRQPNYPVGAEVISEFLGKNWSKTRVRYSLERFELNEKKVLDKKATDILPTERSARNLVKAVKEIKDVTPSQQRRAAERMAKEGNLGEAAARKAILEEKYKEQPKQKKEKLFEQYIKECREDLDRLNKKIRTLFDYQEEFNSDYYRNTFERLDFMASAFKFFDSMKSLLGGNFYDKATYKSLPASKNPA
jgi:ParB-like chromosome segregation protein Spo0J